jgi:predicted ATPase
MKGTESMSTAAGGGLRRADDGRPRASIRTPDQKLRAFVSSTLEELAEERYAAREAIEQLRITPVMFESGARPHPPRAVYRAYVEQSDIFIGIYWQRYGWVAPDMTISGLEDELQLAADMPRLLYVKTPAPAREPALGRMLDGIRAARATAYKKFSDAAELRELIVSDLATLLSERFGVPDRADRWPAIPSPSTALLGREADLAEVIRMVSAPEGRLVVLTGPGGAGKTSVALAVAERTRRQWADGAGFVDLSSVSDPALVPDAIALALGLVGQGREEALDTLERRLADRHMLLVLDNFEQVLDAAPTLAKLIGRAPGLHLLVTSRVVLRIRGEQEWRVDPLAVPAPGASLSALAANPAVQLFVDRARSVRPGFALTRHDAEAVAEMCRRLEGLPLALELAAASMRLLTPEEVLARLPQQLERPGALADLPRRQQTLTTTIQWSYDLLPAQARRMLARLSVFAAPFTTAAAETVAGPQAEDAVQHLSTLLDHSMVSPADRPDGQRAFRLLDPIRRFAAAQLTNADGTFGRLERYLLGVLEAAAPRSGSQEGDMRKLDSELPNLRAVLAWIGSDRRPPEAMIRAIGDVWIWMLVRGHMRSSSTLAQVIAPLLAEVPASGDDRLAWAWLQAGGHIDEGEFTKAIALVDEVLRARQQIENPERTARLFMVRGIARVYNARSPAHEDFAEALAAARTAGDRLLLGYIQSHYGALLYLDGDLNQARTLHQGALTTARALGDENLRAEAHYVLGFDAIAAGDADSAAFRLTAAVRHYRNLDHFDGLARCLAALAALAVLRGDPRLAARLSGTAAAVRDRFCLKPWPWVLQAERPILEDASALLPDGEFTAQLAAGRSQTIDEGLTAAQVILQWSPAGLPHPGS